MTTPRAHEREIALFLVLYVFFAGFTALVAHGLTDDNDHARRVAISAVGIVAGPFVGALNRGSPHEACVEFGLFLLPWGLIPLALGAGALITGRPRSSPVRLALWTIGWLAWYATGIVSLGFALG